MGVSENNGTPKSSILIGFSITNHPFRGIPIFGNTHIPPGEVRKIIDSKVPSLMGYVSFQEGMTNKKPPASFSEVP